MVGLFSNSIAPVRIDMGGSFRKTEGSFSIQGWIQIDATNAVALISMITDVGIGQIFMPKSNIELL